ncbi:T9SS type A sorting domain-containing protein, partial [Tamlana flava]|uniref:T9SS type A sorting domain-containing protein n=1 Tax=Tamlana flava TaxID=3158572 RepID=UPI00351AD550
GNGDCPPDDADFTITIYRQGNAGDDNTDSYCETASGLDAYDLDGLLSNDADGNGTWTPSGPIVDVSTPGVYNFTYTVPGNGDCPPDDADFTITINPNPGCNAANSSEGSEFGLCDGTVLSLSVTPADTSLYDYSWTSNLGTTITNADMPNATVEGAVDGEIFTVRITSKLGPTFCYSECTTTARYYDCTPNCETAFAVKTAYEDNEDYYFVVEDAPDTFSSCFRNDGFKRWGWTNTITEYGTYTYAVYRGAGRCDISKGTYVGDLIVDYQYDDIANDGSGVVHFSYDLLTYDDDGVPATPEVPAYLISEVHLFVGCDPYPFKGNAPDDIYDATDEVKGEYYTVAPGQYPYNANIPSGDYYPGWEATKTGVSGQFYFIAHAVICDRDIPYEGMYIPGEKRDYDDIDLEANASFMDTECTVSTGGWGKPSGDKVSFTAYPVPFENEVNVGYKFEYDTDVKINVYDIRGALIQEAENTNYIKGTYDSTLIDLSRTDDQMYFIRLTTKEGTLIKKVVSSTKQ